MGEKTERQVYLLEGKKQLHAFVLEPETKPLGEAAMVLVNPLFYERTFGCRCFYRVARKLRQRGLRVVVFDFEEYASSRKPLDEPTLDGYLTQIEAAIALAKNLGSEKVGLFGVRSGGLLAYLLASKRQDLSCLALWSPLHRPNSFARELRMKERLRRLQLRKGDEEPPEVAKDEALDANGYVAAPGLLSAVEKIKLDKLDAPGCPVYVAGFKVGTRKVPEPAAYTKVLEKKGQTITTDTTDEDRPWMFTERADPVIPPELLDRTCAWVAETMGKEKPKEKAAPLPDMTIAEQLPEGKDAKDRPLSVERLVSTELDGHPLHGVVHEPLSTVERRRRGFLFLDTSNKLMVDMARALAAEGFPVMRADTGASSTSYGEKSDLQPPVETLWNQAAHLVDVAKKELDVDHIGLSGLCFFAMLSTRVAILRDNVVDRLLLVGMPFHAEGLDEALERQDEMADPPPAAEKSMVEQLRDNAMTQLGNVREQLGEQIRAAQDSENPWVRNPSRKAQQVWTDHLRPVVEMAKERITGAHGVGMDEEEMGDQVMVQESLLAFRGKALHLLSEDDQATDIIMPVIRKLEGKGYSQTVSILPGHASNSFNGIPEREGMVAEVVRWTTSVE